MIKLALLLFAFAVSALPVAAQECIQPASLKITAAELAATVPAFAAQPGGRVLGYAPQPGFTRLLSPAELKQWLGPSASDETSQQRICFAWKMIHPEAEAFEKAMRSELPEGATLTILGISPFPIPASGELHFPWAGLPSTPSGSTEPMLWRGYAEYAPGGKFNVWAQVDVRVPVTLVVLTLDVEAGATVSAESVRLEKVMVRPNSLRDGVSAIESVVGRVARTRLRAGAPVPETSLSKRIDVKKGDVVRVSVRSGASTIGFDATALAAASAGEPVSVRINDTGKILRASLSGPGAAIVILPGGASQQ